MGAWGVNILEEDCAADLHGDYIERFNAGDAHEAIVAALLVEYRDPLEDEDDGPSVWLGIAKAQWECGVLSDRVHDEVRRIVNDGIGLDRWREAGERALAQRERALKRFVDKLAEPNPRPKKRRKGIIRKPVFAAGDCLAIRLEDGDYVAAIVTAVVPETQRPGADTYGINVVAQLDYKSSVVPTADVFEQRQYLKLTHHSWAGRPQVLKMMNLRFQSLRDRFAAVARTAIRPDDPVQSAAFGGWEFAEQVAQQREWDKRLSSL